jgi:hypothetical protein
VVVYLIKNYFLYNLFFMSLDTTTTTTTRASKRERTLAWEAAIEIQYNHYAHDCGGLIFLFLFSPHHRSHTRDLIRQWLYNALLIKLAAAATAITISSLIYLLWRGRDLMAHD